MSRAWERGLTLTEVTVVFVLASIVMTGLTAFYLNTQSVWTDGSAQAISQREATMVLDDISSRTRGATGATFSGSPPRMQIDLQMPGGSPEPTYSYWLAADNRLHGGYFPDGDRGPMLTSEIVSFVAHKDSALLYIDNLSVKSASGSIVTLSTAIAFQNRSAQ